MSSLREREGIGRRDALRGPNARARISRQQRMGRSGGQRRGKEQGVDVGGERGQGEVAHVNTVYRIVKCPDASATPILIYLGSRHS